MTPRTTTPVPRPSVLKRFGPLVAVIVAIGLVAVLSSTGRSSDSSQTVAGLGSSGKDAEKDTSLPDQLGRGRRRPAPPTKYDWGPMCDQETGRLKIPSTYTPPCFVARPGVKGGATAQGVTADKITIVLYQAADTDLGAMLQAKLDPDAVQIDARKKTLDMLSQLMNTWGRTIEIKTLKGSGRRRDVGAGRRRQGRRRVQGVRVDRRPEPVAVLRRRAEPARRALPQLRPRRPRRDVPGQRAVHVGPAPDARAVAHQHGRLHDRADAQPQGRVRRRPEAAGPEASVRRSSTSSRTHRCSARPPR